MRLLPDRRALSTPRTRSAIPSAPTSSPPIAITRAHGTVVVRLEGVLDGSSSEWLGGVLGDLVEGQGNRSIAVNLAAVPHVHPSVVRLLVALSARTTIRGGDFTVQDPSAQVAEQLSESGLAMEPEAVHPDQSASFSGRASGRSEK